MDVNTSTLTPLLLSVDEVAALLGIGRSHFYGLHSSGRLGPPARPLGQTGFVAAGGTATMGPGRMSGTRKMDDDVEGLPRKGLTFALTENRVDDMSMKKAKMGRPPKPPTEKMSHRVCVRLTPAQFQQLVNRAKQAGVSVSAFIQNRLEE